MTTIKIVNSATGEEIERDMTAAELKESEAQNKAWQAFQAEIAKEIAAKQSVLAKLGLTDEEAAALLA